MNWLWSAVLVAGAFPAPVGVGLWVRVRGRARGSGRHALRAGLFAGALLAIAVADLTTHAYDSLPPLDRGSVRQRHASAPPAPRTHAQGRRRPPRPRQAATPRQ
jgi:hypothetical protein